MILFVVECFVVTRKLDGGGGGGGGWMRQSKRNGDYREVRNTFYIILMYCMVKQYGIINKIAFKIVKQNSLKIADANTLRMLQD